MTQQEIQENNRLKDLLRATVKQIARLEMLLSSPNSSAAHTEIIAEQSWKNFQAEHKL